MFKTTAIAIVLAASIIACGARDEQPARSAAAANRAVVPAAPPSKVTITVAQARPILTATRDQLPPDLKGTSSADLESAWAGWTSRHDAEIRARLDGGDEDSLVNFWLYGTTFTTRPRATAAALAGLGRRDAKEDLLLGRLDDLVDGVASPGTNERLRFARQVIERNGIDPTTAAGRDKARAYLAAARERMIADNARYRTAAQSASRLGDPAARLRAYATTYADRGLSSDTSIAADFALDHAFEDAKTRGVLRAGSVRRVAIVGPGLDFTDKAEGYDFYPPQTIQPFAVVDSLVRLGLAQPDDLRLTTFDLSPRVNGHLRAARERASRGDAYVLQLPLPHDGLSHQWHPDLVAYWRRFGSAIGDEVPALAPPAIAGDVRLRAVRVRPAVVGSIVPVDLNIVVERQPLEEDERFDLIVATNILVYYDPFEQALALANIASMLRPGGFFLTNYAVAPAEPMASAASLTTSVEFDRQHNGDTLLWYRRR